MLQSEPSFSIYADEDGGVVEKEKGGLEGCEFSFGKRTTTTTINMGLIVEEGDHNEDDDHKLKQPPSPKMYLATGLGIHAFMRNHVEEEDYHYHYYKMIMMSKGDDVTEAEDHYYLGGSTTIEEEEEEEEDPNDGETLMQYAKLVWELHRDQDTASTYFERAVNAAPGDCNILAAYASFLWDIDQVQDEDYALIDQKTLEIDEKLTTTYWS